MIEDKKIVAHSESADELEQWCRTVERELNRPPQTCEKASDAPDCPACCARCGLS